MGKKLTPDLVMKLIDEGHSQSEIARQFEVSRQLVHKLAKQGGHRPVVSTVTENLPWKVDRRFYQNTAYQAMRLLGHYYLDPDGIKGSSRSKLLSFLRKLEQFNLVIDYDPSYPAVPGLMNTPGFKYCSRESRDKSYVMKIKPDTRITRVGRYMWKMPTVWPEE